MCVIATSQQLHQQNFGIKAISLRVAQASTQMESSFSNCSRMHLYNVRLVVVVGKWIIFAWIEVVFRNATLEYPPAREYGVIQPVCRGKWTCSVDCGECFELVVLSLDSNLWRDAIYSTWVLHELDSNPMLEYRTSKAWHTSCWHDGEHLELHKGLVLKGLLWYLQSKQHYQPFSTRTKFSDTLSTSLAVLKTTSTATKCRVYVSRC